MLMTWCGVESMTTDPYKTLNVDKTATQAEIKEAYKKLAQKHHPDRGGDKEKSQAINDAYAIIGNKANRKRFDETGDHKQPDNRTAAINGIVSLFFLIIEQVDIENTHPLNQVHIFESVKENIKIAKNETMKVHEKRKENINKLEKVKKRITKTGDGENIIFAAIDQRIEELKKQEAETLRMIAIAELSLEILKDYDYQVEFEQFITIEQGWGISSGGSAFTNPGA